MKILAPVAMGLSCLGLAQACWSDDAPPSKPLNLLLTRDDKSGFQSVTGDPFDLLAQLNCPTRTDCP